VLLPAGCVGTGGVPLSLRAHLEGRGPIHLVEGGQAPSFLAPAGLELELSGQALAGPGLWGQRRPGLLFRLAVRNRTALEFRPLFESFRVRDDTGQEMRLSAILDRKGRPLAARALAPGRELAWYVRLDRPQGQPFRHNLELVLHWGFRLGAAEHRVASLFRAEAILTP